MFFLPPFFFGGSEVILWPSWSILCVRIFSFFCISVHFWFIFLLLGTIAITSVPLFMFLSINGATLMIDIHRFPLLNVFMQGVRFEYIYIFFLL